MRRVEHSVVEQLQVLHPAMSQPVISGSFSPRCGASIKANTISSRPLQVAGSGVEPVGHRRERDVDNGRVQQHQELSHGDDREDRPPAHARSRSAGLSMSWQELLAVLTQNSEPARVSDLADRVTLSPSRVCRVRHAMEEQGVVVRLSSPSDARATDARATDDTITEAGRALAHEARAVVAGVLDEAGFNRLTDEEAQVLARILAKVEWE